MGWYSPATVLIKILLQQVWICKIGWNEPLPSVSLPFWKKWSRDLHLITEHPVSRRYSSSDSPVIQKQLHGYCDALQAAHGAVVYLRLLHEDSTVSVSLVTTKTKVAPLNGSIIRRLELCGALLLACLICRTVKYVNIPTSSIFTWCDFTTIIGWLSMSSTCLKSYVANKVIETTKLVPAGHWRYVSTKMNPADLAFRGLHVQQLLNCTLQWQGPEWLAFSPKHWPRRPDINLSWELPELKSTVLLIQQPAPTFHLWKRLSFFHKLVAVVVWIRCNARKVEVVKGDRLTSSEINSAKNEVISLSQSQSYHTEVNELAHGKPIPINSSIHSLCPLISQDGLLRVSGMLLWLLMLNTPSYYLTITL